MGTQIFITIYIPNSFIVNILSPREGKRLSNYFLHPRKRITPDRTHKNYRISIWRNFFHLDVSVVQNTIEDLILDFGKY
jgi:hypothetical protein